MKEKKIEQLISVINQMKEAKKNGLQVEQSKERYYTIYLLKAIFGENINLGILVEIINLTRRFLFETDGLIKYAENENRVYEVYIHSKDTVGKLVANVDNGKLYRGDIRIKWAFNFDIIEFTDGKLIKKGRFQDTEMTFNQDGIEVERRFKNYSDSDKKEIVKSVRVVRDDQNFNIIHVNEIGEQERNFDAIIYDHIFSLDSYEFARTLGIKHLNSSDVEELIQEGLEDAAAYKYFPELLESVKKGLEGSHKKM